MLEPKPLTTYELLSLVVQVFGLAFVALSIAYAARSVRLATRQHERTVTRDAHEFVEKLLDAIESPTLVIQRREVHTPDSILSDPELNMAVHKVLNKLEDLSIVVKRRQYPEDLLRQSLDFLPIAYWRKLGPFVEYLRAQACDPKLWCGLERLAEDWSNNRTGPPAA